MSRRRLDRVIAAVAVAVAGSACALGPDTEPVAIDRPNLSAGTSDLDAEGSSRVYFVGPGEGELLRGVAREATSRNELIDILLRGPNTAELEANYFTAIPPDTKVNSINTLGPVLQLDLSDEIRQLSGPALSHALSQIVYTATDINGIEKVQIFVNGDTIEWPTEVGTASNTGISVYDFPDAVQNSQPAYPALPLVPASRT